MQTLWKGKPVDMILIIDKQSENSHCPQKGASEGKIDMGTMLFSEKQEIQACGKPRKSG